MTQTPAMALDMVRCSANCLGYSTIAAPGIGADNLFEAHNCLIDRAAAAQTP